MEKEGDFENADFKMSASVDRFSVVEYTVTKTKDLGGDETSLVSAVGEINVGGSFQGNANYIGVSGNVTYTGVGIWEITTVYRGVVSNGTYYATRASTSTEPIETHLDFTDVLAGTPDAVLNGAVFESNEDDASFKHWPADAPHDLGGVKSYLVPTAELVQTEYKHGSAWDNLGASQVGTRVTPTSYPTGLAGADWLVVAHSQSFEGGMTKIEKVFKRSGKDGWNNKIYD